MSTRLMSGVSADKTLLHRYLDLPQPETKIMATYIWIDGTGENLRGKQHRNYFLVLRFFFSLQQQKLEQLIKNLNIRMNYHGGILMDHQQVKLKVQILIYF